MIESSARQRHGRFQRWMAATLVSMGEPPDQEWSAQFDYVRVYRLER
jgi:hypothetical protein